jgi:hypothetical protein
MYKRILAASAVAASVALFSAPAAGQAQNGLVNVNVSDVTVTLEDIISDNNINVQVPVGAVVQVPIGIAANVCNISAAVLAKQASDAAPCDATNETASRAELTTLARSLQRK